MTIIPIPVGPEPTPEFRWVGPEAVRRIRGRCTTTAVLLMLWAPVATVATLVLGGLLPMADHPIHDLAMIWAVVLPLIVGTAALGARRYVQVEHVDVAGGRVLGRGMLRGLIALVGAVVTRGALRPPAPPVPGWGRP